MEWGEHRGRMRLRYRLALTSDLDDSYDRNRGPLIPLISVRMRTKTLENQSVASGDKIIVDIGVIRALIGGKARDYSSTCGLMP